MAKDIESLVRQQAALASFGSFAFREADLIRILQEAARVCADALGVRYGNVCRYRPAENDLLIEAGIGWKPGVVGNVASPADQRSPQGRALVTGGAVIVYDLKQANTHMMKAISISSSASRTCWRRRLPPGTGTRHCGPRWPARRRWSPKRTGC